MVAGAAAAVGARFARGGSAITDGSAAATRSAGLGGRCGSATDPWAAVRLPPRTDGEREDREGGALEVDGRGVATPAGAAPGADGRDVEGRFAAVREVDVRGVDVRGVDGRGVVARAVDVRELVARGADARVVVARGVDAREVVARGVDAGEVVTRGVDAGEVVARGVDARVVVARAVDGREPDVREPDARVVEVRETDRGPADWAPRAGVPPLDAVRAVAGFDGPAAAFFARPWAVDAPVGLETRAGPRGADARVRGDPEDARFGVPTLDVGRSGRAPAPLAGFEPAGRDAAARERAAPGAGLDAGVLGAVEPRGATWAPEGRAAGEGAPPKREEAGLSDTARRDPAAVSDFGLEAAGVARGLCRDAAAGFFAVFLTAPVLVAISSSSDPEPGTGARGRRHTPQSTNGPVPSRLAPLGGGSIHARCHPGGSRSSSSSWRNRAATFSSRSGFSASGTAKSARRSRLARPRPAARRTRLTQSAIALSRATGSGSGPSSGTSRSESRAASRRSPGPRAWRGRSAPIGAARAASRMRRTAGLARSPRSRPISSTSTRARAGRWTA